MFTKKFGFSLGLALMLAALLIAPNAAPADASMVATLNGRMGAEVQISPTQTPTDADRHMPQAAYNTEHKEFLVVWHNKWSASRDIYGQRLDSQGKKIGGAFSISSGIGDRVQPAVVYNSEEGLYLVVFMQDVSAAHDGTKYDIKGQFVGWNGALLGSSITIQTWEGQSFWSPKITFNANFNEYMVVWTTRDSASGLSLGIGMRILDHYGNSLYGTIVTGDGYPTSPDLVWDPVHDHYLITWQYVNVDGKQAIAADLRDTLGNRMTPPGIFSIYYSNTYNAYYPSVAYSEGMYGVVYEFEAGATDHDVYITFVYYDGSFKLGPITVDASLSNDTHTVIAGSPRATGGQEFIILFQRAGVNGASVWMRPITAYLPGENREVCSYIFWDCTTPAIARGAGGYLMLYTLASIGDPSIKQHVFGRMFWQFNLNLPQILK